MSNSPLTYARGCVRDCGTPEARVFAVLLIFLILLILLILSGLLQNMLFLALPVNGVIYPYSICGYYDGGLPHTVAGTCGERPHPNF